VIGTTPVRAVLFDLDGVLVDGLAAMRTAFERAYAEAVGPGPAPFDRYVAHLGRPLPEILQILELPAALAEPFVRESAGLVGQVRCCEGAEELLAKLSAAGLRIAVVTGKARARAELVLRSTGLLTGIDLVFGSDDVPAGKPAPDMVELALHRFGLRPDEAVLVGDSPIDLQAAAAAGVPSIAAEWGYSTRAELIAAEPTWSAGNCLAVLDILAERT
jgi:AHBA synthesis associated protein